ncbi:3-phosphoserine/phosphohydroxythreonine transaminase [Apibacter muscae]|uniref:Phosphoserine aminotransferase n=1 Tax=Apibacter muscae TaxID=2509004 RepID=A0A563D9E6_9FLAO|nr:3-phosphoserine/phosphohydroxythreonine transaminase [Apibacter muscae]TWP26737.1 3-phosphoserine/phosphohydroxythreonine transaminase [Apibacter muscae]TWP27632.1 3-phosphoserine/phosphohydroxythreonine transaminase [Apibacter muscae]
MKKYNFSAGPSTLPEEVLQQAAEAVLNLNNSGTSLIEISHRSKDFIAIMDEARSLVKKLMKLDDNHEVLYLQGGASLQFSMIPYNLLKNKAAYIDSGNFASSAIKEAKKIGSIEVLASSKDDKYTYIPKNFEIPKDVDYLHLTSNNTVYGTELKEFPETDVPLVCDMSSDILSRDIDFNKFGLIYAGAQKNIGPAGVTLVIVNKNLLGKTDRNLPSYLDYQIHIEKESMANTPPVFAVYATLLNLRWLDKQGGVSEIEKKNREKAALLYGEIDRNPLFRGVCVEEDRSLMNACFFLNDEATYKAKFDELVKQANIIGINGYRTVGGYRASIYNAMPLEGVQTLVNVMKELEKIA